jgi:hypothetical protein
MDIADSQNEKRAVLTMEDLSAALQENGVGVKRGEFYH